MELRRDTAALKAMLDALPGVTTIVGMTRGRSPQPISIRYRVMEKMFAILAVREALVVLKCDPHMIEILKEQYAGVGHRTHLDHRHWIAVQLEADVPLAEVERLLKGAYDLVRAGLTRKQRAELDALG